MLQELFAIFQKSNGLNIKAELTYVVEEAKDRLELARFFGPGMIFTDFASVCIGELVHDEVSGAPRRPPKIDIFCCGFECGDLTKLNSAARSIPPTRE